MSTLTEQFLTWVADRPRTYADAMEAWRSTCPRLSIWEDALGDELVRLERGSGGLSDCRVVLTPRGEAMLRDCGEPVGSGVARTMRAVVIPAKAGTQAATGSPLSRG